jgi:tetratricopeptide (TPR) repeat protein
MLAASTACTNLLKQDENVITKVELSNRQEPTVVWSKKSVDLFNQGNQNLDSDVVKAANYFNQAIFIEPKMEAAYFNLLKIYSVIESKRLESQNPGDKTSVNREQMQQIFQKAEKENILSARMLTLMGSEKRSQGKFNEAEKFYQLALNKDENYLVVLVNMAILQDLYLHNLVTAKDYYIRYQLQLVSEGKEDTRVVNWLTDIKRRIAKDNKEKSK